MTAAPQRTRLARLVARMAEPRYAAAVAALLALAAYALGPPGGDAASHLYQTQVFAQEGWRFWDNLWYGGRYSQINYSLTYYPLAAFLGTGAVVTAAAAGAAGAFADVVRRQWPLLAPASAVAFSLMIPLAVVAGTYPFLLAVAPALATLGAIQRGRAGTAIAAAALTMLTHPLAFAFLVAGLAGVALATPGWWRRRAALPLAGGLGAIAIGEVFLLRAFTAPGSHYPFDPKDALATAGFCAVGVALTHGSRDQRPLRMLFAAYAVLAAGAYAFSSPLGGNVVRLLLLMGTPLLLLPLAARGFRPRGVAVAVLAGTLVWQALPAVAGWSATRGAQAPSREFWYPVEAFLDRHRDPNYRVEVVATSDNWEAYYLARRGVPLARGWYRQDDWPANAALYRPLSVAGYQRWLRRMGVRYVLLPNDPLDPSTRYEAERLRDGAGLDVVARIGGWTVYELPGATPIATPRGAISVRRMTAEEVTLAVSRPGVYHLRLRYTPYWQVTRGAACVAPRAPFGTELRVMAPGLVRIEFHVGVGTMVSTALGGDGSGCPDPPPPSAPATSAPVTGS
jgi:hypothetical protein